MKAGFRSRLTRSVLIAIATTTTTFTLAAITPTPASAATKVTFCNAVSNTPVVLTYYNFDVGRWLPYRNGRSNASGCGTFLNTRSDLFLQVESRVQVNNNGVNSVW